MVKKIAFLFVLVVSWLNAVPVRATSDTDTTTAQRWTLRFQQTVITQYHPDFTARYSGLYSLQTHEKAQTSLTTTLFAGFRLWKGASFYFNPELAGGSGLSQARGIAGFTNGETFRIGNPEPKIYVARLYFRQVFALSKKATPLNDDVNQLAGSQPTSFLAINVGKFSIADFYDGNAYSHDPRRQFLNWALMSNGAWDYPANTRGYTYGLVVEWINPAWELRFSSTMVPEQANGPYLDLNVGKAHSETLEWKKSYFIGSQPGTFRLLTFMTHANMGNYQQALAQTDRSPDITQTRLPGRTKYGFGINVEQRLSDQVGMFARTSWNDGKNETWAFTEIDESISLGLSIKGDSWKRQSDHLGIAVLANGLSQGHRDYLKAGGYGFIIGDGALHYSPEMIAEAYYSFHVPGAPLWLTPDYQFVLNPAYNRDRGPVHVLALRAHVEF